MTQSNLDLSKLKKEIHDRKSKKETNLKESDGTTSKINAKDGFLNGLIESLNNGTVNEASNIVRNINRTAEIRANGGVVSQKSQPNNGGNSSITQELAQYGRAEVNVPNQKSMTPQERDYLLYEEMERKRKEMLNGGARTHQNNNYPQNASGSVTINEEKLTESVVSVVTDKFGFIVEQAMKDNLVEIYSKARMKETIEENRKIIKEIVYETIREIQNKNKKKSQS